MGVKPLGFAADAASDSSEAEANPDPENPRPKQPRLASSKATSKAAGKTAQPLGPASLPQEPIVASDLPADWPDPRGFVPACPQGLKPAPRPQHDPIMSHTRIYHAQDAQFTQRLESYINFRDDARFGGVAAFLQRPDDFIRFCCYLHVTETLTARGGAGESRVVWRWPISR